LIFISLEPGPIGSSSLPTRAGVPCPGSRQTTGTGALATGEALAITCATLTPVGGATFEQLVTTLAQAYRLAPEVAAEVVERFLATLRERGLLATDG
jgi:hypothetical protein